MNTTCTVRGWISEDIPELREIFAASFGDPPEVIDAFHRTFLSGPDCCAVAAVPDAEKPSGKAVAAGYLLPGPVLCFPDLEDIPAAYLYALGCLPDYRRRGIGLRMVQLATDITKIVYTKRGVSDFDLYDHDAFCEAYGFTPLQFIDVRETLAALARGEAAEKVWDIYEQYSEPEKPKDEAERLAEKYEGR